MRQDVCPLDSLIQVVWNSLGTGTSKFSSGDSNVQPQLYVMEDVPVTLQSEGGVGG